MKPSAGSGRTGSLTVMQVVPQLKMGGVERGTVEFAHHLKQTGHRSLVVSYGGPLVKDLQNCGVEHIELNVKKKSLSSLLSIKKLRRLINELNVDVVHARSRVPAWLCYWALRKIKGRRPVFVTTLHGLHSVNRYSSVMARGDQVIAVSETAKAYLEQHFPHHLKQQPMVIYRGIDQQFSFQHQPDVNWLKAFQAKLPAVEQLKTVLLPGRLSRLKGFEYLMVWLEAAPTNQKLLLTAVPDESNYSREVMGLLQQRKVADKVIWLGIERQMADLYAAVDLVVSVNRKPESFGRTVLESLSVGTPVVAFAHGGVNEVMNQLYPEGLVRVGNADMLAQKVAAFLQAAPAVQPHDGFKNQVMFESTVGVYQRLLKTQYA